MRLKEFEVMNDKLLKAESAAAFAGVSVRTLKRWVKEKKLKPVIFTGPGYVGRKTHFYRISDIRKLMV